MNERPGETRFAVLLFTDIVGSAELKARYGVPAYGAALRVHNDLFERLSRQYRSLRILQNLGDGYFAEAGSVTEAVCFALLFQEAMRAGPWNAVRLTTRIGIHAGEVAALSVEVGSGIVAPAADLTARVMSLALGGQILLTRFPFDEARHFLREHPPIGPRPSPCVAMYEEVSVVGSSGTDLQPAVAAAGDGRAPTLRWLAHGPYLLKGCDEPVEVFEVGAEGLAPLTPPPDSEKAKRAIRPGEEETLGWRPALGLEIPGRPGWRLIERLGAGGFGEVWAGEHAKLRERRAFKFCFDDERLRALKREVTLVRLLRTALGERDDIVRLRELKLDAPPFYLESDLAPHGNLLQWAEKKGGLANVPLAQRIALVADTASALAAAHSLGVLHKDIKPTNILIFDGPDGAPRPRLVDFGIGTLSDPSVLGEHGITPGGFTRTTGKHSTGTPTYSPPEYIAGKPYTIQGDIYGLGVLLYQLIAADGTRPVAAGWERDVADPLLRDDIAACVDGDPARRPASASDLAKRLRSLDQRRAETAEKNRLAEALRQKQEEERMNAKYRGLLAEVARSDRLIAEEKLRYGREPAAFAHLARACQYDPQSGSASEKAFAALNLWRHLPPKEMLLGHEAEVSGVEFSPDGTRILTVSRDRTARLWDSTTGRLLVTFVGHEDDTRAAGFSPDGLRVVTASRDKTARVWDAATGQSLATLAGHLEGVVAARFSPDGVCIVTASADKTAIVWEWASAKAVATLAGHKYALNTAEFSPDGTRVVTASWDETSKIWDATNGQALATLAGHRDAVLGATFNSDSTRIVTASRDNTARLWEARTGQALAVLAGHEWVVWDAQFDRRGTLIVTASADKTARVWDALSGKTLATLDGHTDQVRGAMFSPDGASVLTWSTDETARVWDAAAGKPLAVLAGHNNGVNAGSFSRNGKLVGTAAADKTVRIWSVPATRRLTAHFRHEDGVIFAQFSRDSARIMTSALDGTARVWNATTGKELARLAPHECCVDSAGFDSDGTRVVTSGDKCAQVWDAVSGKAMVTLAGHEDMVYGVRFSPDGARLVTGSKDETARIWSAATGETLAVLAGHQGLVQGAQFSPDGTRVVTRSSDKTARVWDSETGQALAVLAGHQSGITCVQFSPNGEHIVTASLDHTARVWHTATGTELATLVGHEHVIDSACFSPAGTRILTASWDKTARLWDAATGKALLVLAGHENGVLGAQFNDDGSRIVSASWDNTARVWDANTGKALATLVGHDGHINCAEFSPDGSRIVTASEDGTAFVWDMLPPRAGPPPDWFADFLRFMAHMRLNSDGELETLRPEDWLALRERLRAALRASVGADTPYLRLLRKWVRE